MKCFWAIQFLETGARLPASGHRRRDDEPALTHLRRVTASGDAHLNHFAMRAKRNRKTISEDFVSRTLLQLSIDCGWTVFAYHPPGGQASPVVHLLTGDAVYPDMLAYKRGVVACFENKARHCVDDVVKLQRILADDVARRRLESLAQRAGMVATTGVSIVAVHGFGGVRVPKLAPEFVTLMCVNELGIVTSRPCAGDAFSLEDA